MMASWRSNRLSFAGRVQIIKSILGTLHNYWSSSFILPKGITKCIESKLRSFLWKGCDGQGYAKVQWGHVCLPKESGGPGIKSVAATNAGLMSKHLWAIITNNQHSLWHINYTMDNGADIWLWQDPWFKERF
ncbi:UNVERIFIED_CONTAM: hypothetical protein Slati_2667500 [Sesamum latifolium]|uniref:Uncharacterized protein n=1 Tax=Sesamum latifolium TaxID=2727402 RepID=A0AAW2VUV4_9LAMI